MNIKCLFGVHQPTLGSIKKKSEGYAALCEVCARPLVRTPHTGWKAAEPLDAPVPRVA
jgi:hypothetical protein